MEADQMVNHPSQHETLEPQVDEYQEPEEVNTAPDIRIWLRRKLILKVTLFFVCFVGVGLVLLLLDS